MGKSITKIVLTGGPAAGKTTLISRILKEFKREDGWRVITVPETATELISGFGIKPFDDCVSMEDFQYFVIEDQLHKERLALKGARMTPEEKVLVIYDRAVMDDKAYVSEERFIETLAYFGKTEGEMLANYDAVLHLVSCAKGAEFAYNFGNAARYESVEDAIAQEERTLKAWAAHPARYVIDNSVDFEDKINRAVARIYQIVGQSLPEQEKRKYLIAMPAPEVLKALPGCGVWEMEQTYLMSVKPQVERRIRRQPSGGGFMYFYTEKRLAEDGQRWVTERHISEKEYMSLLWEADDSLRPVKKTKYRLEWRGRRLEIDVYPFSRDRAILFVFGPPMEREPLPKGIEILKDVTGDEAYKNRRLAQSQAL